MAQTSEPFLQEFSGFYILFSFQGSLFCCCRFSRQPDYYITASFACQQFFQVFWNSFLKFFKQSRTAEGGIWTRAPLLTTYSLSRGAPSTTWVLLHLVESHSLRNPIYNSVPGTNLAQLRATVNGESGIRTHAPFRTNGFQDRLVMTTSISLQAFSQTYFCILSHVFDFVKRFFQSFFFFWHILEYRFLTLSEYNCFFL